MKLIDIRGPFRCTGEILSQKSGPITPKKIFESPQKKKIPENFIIHRFTNRIKKRMSFTIYL